MNLVLKFNLVLLSPNDKTLKSVNVLKSLRVLKITRLIRSLKYI